MPWPKQWIPGATTPANHSKKVAECALALAGSLRMEPLETKRLEACALLHDIGKIGISDEILNKPGELTAEEWAAVKTHPQLGATIVSRVPQLVIAWPVFGITMSGMTELVIPKA